MNASAAMRFVAVVCIMIVSATTSAWANTGHTSVHSDLIELIRECFDDYYGLLEPNEQSDIDDQRAKPYISDERNLPAARRASSTAVVMAATASSQYSPVVLAAAAALSVSEDPLILNNLGTILHGMGETDKAIAVLQYADTLLPASPVILTNLGNSYLDQGFIDEAETAYNQALEYDAQYSSAHHGLSVVSIIHQNGQKAMDELVQAAQTGYTPSMRTCFLAAKGLGGRINKPFWDVIIEDDHIENDYNQSPGSQDSPGDDQSNENTDYPQDKLILPVLPKWESRMAFLASAPHRQAFVEDVMQEGLIGAITFALQYHADDIGQEWQDAKSMDEADVWFEDDWAGDDWEDEDYWNDEGNWTEEGGWLAEDDWNDEVDQVDVVDSIQLEPAYGHMLFWLELVNDYYAEMIAQVYDRNNMKRQQIDETFAQGLTSLKESHLFDQLQQKIIANDIHGAKTLGKEVNKIAAQLADEHFYQWRDLTLDTYSRLTTLLYEYWSISDTATADVYDESVMDYINQVRKLTVYTAFLPIALDFSTLPQSYALADYIAPIVEKDEDLSVYAADPIQPLAVPEKKAKECGLKQKLVFELGPASFSVTCDTWELEVLEGIGGAYKRNFKTGESEISVLVGVKATAGAGPIKGELSAKTGVTMRFDSDGNFTGWSQRGDAGAKVGTGPIGTSANVGGTSDLGAISSPRMQSGPDIHFGW